MAKETSQQEFLRAAMNKIGALQGLGRPLTREEMCERLGCPIGTFNKWFKIPTSDNDPNVRPLPETMRHHIREVIAHEQLKKKVAKQA